VRRRKKTDLTYLRPTLNLEQALRWWTSKVRLFQRIVEKKQMRQPLAQMVHRLLWQLLRLMMTIVLRRHQRKKGRSIGQQSLSLLLFNILDRLRQLQLYQQSLLLPLFNILDLQLFHYNQAQLPAIIMSTFLCQFQLAESASLRVHLFLPQVLQ